MVALREDKDAETPWQAGTRMLGINLSVLAAWTGPLLVTFWFVAWVLSHSLGSETTLPTNARPLDVVHHVLAWGGWSTTHPDSIAAWIVERPAVGQLAIACVVFGVSLRHDVLVSIGLLGSVQALGVVNAAAGIVSSTLAIALCSAVVLKGDELSFINRLLFAVDMWVRRVLIDVCAMPVLILLVIAIKLFERYSLSDLPSTSADELAEDISQQLPNPQMTLGEVPADQAAHTLAVILASTRSESRADEITKNSWRLRRRRPTGAANLTRH